MEVHRRDAQDFLCTSIVCHLIRKLKMRRQMTISVPPSKVKKLLKYYFSGLSQQLIAEKVGISQGSVSHWVSKFEKKAINNGLLKAAKEHNVFDEIVELRALAVELDKAGMSTAEVKIGTKIMKKFKKLGIEPEQHEALVEVCAQVKDPDFIVDVLKLHQIKVESGVDYSEVIVQYEKTVQGLPLVKAKLGKVEADLHDAATKVEEKKKEIDSLQKKLDLACKLGKGWLAKIKKEVADKEKEAKLTQKEIKQVAVLKADLAKQGLDIPTLIKLAKEFGHGEIPD